jgi:hypothetical protein
LVIPAVGAVVFDVTVIASVSVHPFAAVVAVTVYVAADVKFWPALVEPPVQL